MNRNIINWQNVYKEQSPKLLGICRRYITDLQSAEDIVQDSFITAIQKNHQLKDEKTLFAWLKKIVVNNALQYIRKQSKEAFVITEPSEIPDIHSEMEHPLLEEKNIFVYDFTNEELLSSIDSLPPHHKSVFNLYFIENYSHSEISGLLGITVNTSKSHLLRAKKSVRNYLLKNVVRHDTPKKKTAQLLVIFGLGGWLWAQTFQSKFSDFSILPSKKLENLPDIEAQNLSFSSSNAFPKKRMMIGVAFLVIILLSVFLLNSPKPVFWKNNSVVSPDYVTEKPNPEKTTIQKPEKTPESDLKPDENLNKTELLNTSQETISENQTPKEKSIKTNKSKGLIADSAKDVPQKVIVVKKIIQRDTIFVER